MRQITYRAVAAAAMLVLAGCAHEPVAVASPRVAAAAAPETVYSKPGASTEEFQRAKANCLMRAEIAESSSADPNGFARAATWMTVFSTCMRADGWVLVPKR